MNVVQTALVFLGIPLGLTLLLVAAVYGRTLMHQNRYRPGRPWSYPPVWYVPHPRPSRRSDADRPSGVATSSVASVSASPGPSARMGGASGEW